MIVVIVIVTIIEIATVTVVSTLIIVAMGIRSNNHPLVSLGLSSVHGRDFRPYTLNGLGFWGFGASAQVAPSDSSTACHPVPWSIY